MIIYIFTDMGVLVLGIRAIGIVGFARRLWGSLLRILYGTG